MVRKRLLLNHVYYRPVGHVIEAIKYSKGYHDANKEVDIYLLLNSDSPMELADACPWVKKTYPVSLHEIWSRGKGADCLRRIPKSWDYVIHSQSAKSFQKGFDENNLIRAQKVLQSSFKATIAEGCIKGDGPKVLPYHKNAKVVLEIPEKARKSAKQYSHEGPKICIMLGGSAGSIQSPSIRMWLGICKALYAGIPNLKIYFTGVSKSAKGRTRTKGFTLDDVEYLINRLPNAESAYDIGLWNQLALISSCDIFLSPHTGFAFLAPLVGTPWLAISGCPWPEYFFNGLKFYSVLPECGSYPSKGDTKEGCGWLLAHDKKALCMSDKLLAKKVPEIVRGARLLLDPKFTYRKAMALHLNKISKPPYGIEKFFFFDK